MLTIAVFLICYCKTGVAPIPIIVVGTACVDMGCAMFYMFVVNFSISYFYSTKRDYVMTILTIKKEKKNDQGASQIPG